MTSNTIKCHIDFLTIMICKYDQNVVKMYSFQQYYVSFQIILSMRYFNNSIAQENDFCKKKRFIRITIKSAERTVNDEATITILQLKDCRLYL